MVLLISKCILLPILVLFTLMKDNEVAGDAREEIIKEAFKSAKEFTAPFTKTAAERLHGNVFGSGRASRSTDIIVYNQSDRDYELESNSCDHGGFSSGLFPPDKVPAKSSLVYGMESNGFMTGCTCSVTYKTTDGKTNFRLDTHHPYIGSFWVETQQSSDIKVVDTIGRGDNNVVRFLLKSV